ncbi:hypothetical protein MBOT_28170 [Mycobacterium botniense]|uniref:Uncharacterized protein n=1 Tax=Mycobacterium botniense TaxID=84962 RepID=A0A7I9Y059_9MYCO|nr:hypothetical protein MBOT_28170 [Mycobacterium botniense]
MLPTKPVPHTTTRLDIGHLSSTRSRLPAHPKPVAQDLTPRLESRGGERLFAAAVTGLAPIGRAPRDSSPLATPVLTVWLDGDGSRTATVPMRLSSCPVAGLPCPTRRRGAGQTLRPGTLDHVGAKPNHRRGVPLDRYPPPECCRDSGPRCGALVARNTARKPWRRLPGSAVKGCASDLGSGQRLLLFP